MSHDQAADPRHQALAASLGRGRLDRRQALWVFGAAVSATATLGASGCAKSPVTGERILVGMSESQEKQVDLESAPHQFSADLGAIQDGEVNDYVSEVGAALHGKAQRKGMPYSYRVLNANYVNAYTFPAGSVGVTRGIMTELDDEAELAALLGHELGHVNARHAAQRQGQAMVGQVAVVGLGVATADSQWSPLIQIASQLGASALLSSYSRDNEREADALGQQYLVEAGYPAQGMVGLHQMLVDMHSGRPSLMETMFSSHPMSEERRDTAKRLAEGQYAATKGRSQQRERYMDRVASLRRIKPTIDACKNGEEAMAGKKLTVAQQQFSAALKRTPQDYAANLRMGQCLQAMGQATEARQYANAAKQIYPTEAQAHKLGAVLALQQRDPQRAWDGLQAFDKLLPGDPGTLFLKGLTLESAGQTRQAAAHYNAFLQSGVRGDAAGYASTRLQAWSRR